MNRNDRNRVGAAFGAMIAGLTLLAGSAAAQAAVGDAPASKPAAQPSAEGKLPSGKDVLEKYLEKTGGRETYGKITSRVSTGKLEIKAAGISAAVTIAQGGDGKFRVTTDIKGMGVQEQGFDGTTAWETSPMAGPRILTGEEREDLLGEVPLNSELKFAENFTSIETVGEETVGDKPAYKVLLKTKSGSESTRWYDKTSGLLVKTAQVSKSAQGEIKIESYPGDWRPVDGVLMPFATKQVAAGQEYTLTVEKVEQNQAIAPERFTAPEDVQKLVAKGK